LALVVGLGLVGWFLHFPLRLVGLVGLLSLLLVAWWGGFVATFPIINLIFVATFGIINLTL
jgi:hypothetical protein